MKNVLEICLSPYIGGLELYMKNITKELNTLAVINKNSQLKEIFNEENINYFDISRYNIFKLARIIDSEKIDIIHIHWTKDIPIVIFAKLLSKRKPKIVQTRHMHMTRFKNDIYHKFLYKNINLIIAVTNLVNDQLKKFIPQEIRPKIITSYIGADTPELLTNEEKINLKQKLGLNNEFIVTIVGRVEEAKAQHIVLEAINLLKKDNLNVKALVVGGASNQKYFDKIKAKYNDTIFTGFVSNPTDFMQISDCIVLATKKETFGLVLIEAMKCEICIIGSNQGGPIEIINDNQSGLLFETMNSNDLYNKLKILYENNIFKNMLAKNGKNKADILFDSKKQFSEIKNILQSV